MPGCFPAGKDQPKINDPIGCGKKKLKLLMGFFDKRLLARRVIVIQG